MISARRAARRSGFGRGLVILAAVLAVIGAIGGILLPWSEVARAQREFALRVETSDNRFVAPGSLSMDLPAGRIFVNYFTDETFGDDRYSTSSELVFDLVVTGPDGEPIAVEHEPTQRANLPSSRPGRSAAAILIGTAPITEAGLHDIKLDLQPGEAAQAVAEVLVMTAAEQAVFESALWPGLGFGCGIAGGAFFGVAGLLAIWLEKRAGLGR